MATTAHKRTSPKPPAPGSWNGVLTYAADVHVDAQGQVQLDAPFINNGGDVSHDAASLTKMMTLYETLKELHERHIDPGDTSFKIKISDRASHAKGTLMSEGEELPLPKALAALMTNSDNGIAVAISEKMGGDFLGRMNATATDLNLTHTHFYNVNGLPPYEQWDKKPGAPQNLGKDAPHNTTTPQDMAILVARLANDYPEAAQKAMGLDSVQYGPEKKPLPAHHSLNDADSPLKEKGYNIVAKTGTSNDALHNIAVRTIAPNGKQQVVIIMNSGWVNGEVAKKAGVRERKGVDTTLGSWHRGDAFQDALVSDILLSGKLPDVTFDGPRLKPGGNPVKPEQAQAKAAPASHIQAAKTSSHPSVHAPKSHSPAASHGHKQGEAAHHKRTSAELASPLFPPADHPGIADARAQFQLAMDTGGTPSVIPGDKNPTRERG